MTPDEARAGRSVRKRADPHHDARPRGGLHQADLREGHREPAGALHEWIFYV